MLGQAQRGMRGVSIVEVAIIVLVAGVQAMVAVPSFLKYLRTSQQAEATDNLARIRQGAGIYFASSMQNENGHLNCRFPSTRHQTPLEGYCCMAKQDGGDQEDRRCDLTPENWQAPTWKALGFEVVGKSYFVYTFSENQLANSAAQFTATANADLDCDGTFSTFQIYGSGAKGTQADPDECYLEPTGGAIYSEKSME